MLLWKATHQKPWAWAAQIGLAGFKGREGGRGAGGREKLGAELLSKDIVQNPQRTKL